jgi:hypothetical protein
LHSWVYPVLLVLRSLQKSQLYSVLNNITGEHLMAPISPHECNTKQQLSKNITTVLADVSSLSVDERDYLLDTFSSNDHIESIYLFGKPPETSQQWNEFFTKFPKVCIFCDDQGQLVIRWTLDMINDCRISGNQCNEKGDRTTARTHFQRGIDLYSQLRDFIGTNNEK